MPKKYEKVTNNIGRCLECGESCNNRYIGNHIKLSHNMTSKEYFDKFHRQDGDGICIECDKETKFLKLSKGYRKTCGKKCGSKMTRRLFFEEHGYYNDFSFSGNVAMCKATMIERYGNDSLSSLEFVKEKRKKTNVERFGVECNFNIPFFQKDSCLKKYGVESVAHIPGVKESRIKTNLKRYGSEHPMQNEEVARRCIDGGGARANSKKYRTIFGNTLLAQGSFELSFIKFCEENNIRISRGPIIRYDFKAKGHQYFIDFKIEIGNLTKLVEIKSTYWYLREKERMDIKILYAEEYCKQLNWKYHFIISDDGLKGMLNIDKFKVILEQ